MLGLLGEHFALQDDAPATQTTAALTCLNNLEHSDREGRITEGGRSYFPALATGLTFDQASCCDQLGGQSSGDHLLPSKYRLTGRVF